MLRASQGIVRDTIQVRWETFKSHYGQFNQNMYEILSESASFCKRYDNDKTFWCVFRFTVPTAVHESCVSQGSSIHYLGEGNV